MVRPLLTLRVNRRALCAPQISFFEDCIHIQLCDMLNAQIFMTVAFTSRELNLVELAVLVSGRR